MPKTVNSYFSFIHRGDNATKEIAFSDGIFTPKNGACEQVSVGRSLCLRQVAAAMGNGIGKPLPRAPEHGRCIYLDYQATTPVWPEVAAAAEPYLRLHWGNPSSGHAFARPCAKAIQRSRIEVAQLIGAHEDEILFTACGSEADNHAILGALEAEEARRRNSNVGSSPLPHVVTSNVEHPAIEQCLVRCQLSI